MEKENRRPNILGIIPARYASTRLPGKPLCTIGGKTLIQHVYERSMHALKHVIVATDDKRIYDEVQRFGGQAIITDGEHHSGTDRIREAMDKSQYPCDIVVNIQGDEPFVSHNIIQDLVKAFDDPLTDIATPIHPYPHGTTIEEVSNPNEVKVVSTADGYALYFSRLPIPYFRNFYGDLDAAPIRYYKHIGLYAYRSDVLRAITELPVSLLESAEGLEQLRWLQAGYQIKTIPTMEVSIGIDTPEDLELARHYYKRKEQK